VADAKTEVAPATGGQAPAPSPLATWGLDRVVLDYVGLSLTGKDDERSRRNLARDMGEMATELAGPNPSAAVRILAETAAICWAELRRAEIVYIGGSHGSRTIDQADHQQRRIDRCHSRLMRTLRTLAQVRRLERDAPAVQVNVMQAVNVGGPAPGPARGNG
jgi:hypothetical protein